MVPIATLPLPSLLPNRASKPIAVLLTPVVFKKRAPSPVVALALVAIHGTTPETVKSGKIAMPKFPAALYQLNGDGNVIDPATGAVKGALPTKKRA